ncbi:carboxylating nicotinate-nucleotide diphosphorylase [Olsenella profusa]|uniref:Nicotinate-nucleotide pyrophosphorylase [carboxylating] n=1 Tax=Olsenella profusa F0195 TaxID=1125712 RepID=U2TXC6_9ACTN|nr:carboxylating nicotinate-nucleotide diphosphorylase [Olsenella profusa]ERL10688.1 nicotinate-nucleotide diphosphorylase (carboxylating) [Olsenella profusa F0195]
MRETTLRLQAEPLIRSALREDITNEDVSTISVVDGTERGRVHLLAKEDGVICGLDVFERTFQLLDPTARLKAAVREGDDVTVGEELGVVHGHVEALLSGERVALNFLQRMSGIATLTRAMARELAGTRTRLVDTRKTTPNMRVFEREAVRVGGGANHRYNLSDGVMLKDNHIDAAGGISQAVAAARARAPFVRKVEVEVENLVQLREALAAGADIVMLDNMDLATMRTAVGMVDGRAEVEVSGNVTLGRLHDLAELGVDVISCGALTHSAPILDLSLKHLVVTGRRAS